MVVESQSMSFCASARSSSAVPSFRMTYCERLAFSSTGICAASRDSASVSVIPRVVIIRSICFSREETTQHIISKFFSQCASNKSGIIAIFTPDPLTPDPSALAPLGSVASPRVAPTRKGRLRPLTPDPKRFFQIHAHTAENFWYNSTQMNKFVLLRLSLLLNGCRSAEAAGV